jgi:hypothetical protein
MHINLVHVLFSVARTEAPVDISHHTGRKSTRTVNELHFGLVFVTFQDM